MCVCVYVCMYVCIYIYMYVCICGVCIKKWTEYMKNRNIAVLR